MHRVLSRISIKGNNVSGKRQPETIKKKKKKKETLSMDKAHSVLLLSRMSLPKKENLLMIFSPPMPHDEKSGDVS